MKKILFSILVIIVSTGSIFGQVDSLKVLDTRAIATTPTSYDRSLKAHFKSANIMGLPGAGYNIVIGLRGWSDNTGGKSHELAFSNDSKLFFRSGYSPTWEAWRQILVSDANGNYGIGTPSPTEKLAVNGNIRAKEIRVEVANWPDYVFGEDYKLPTLQDTEQHIKEKGHLEGIPSAKEVKANGLDLGEMNAKLLQKIEELTLHLIEMKKENEVMKDRMLKLEK